MKHKQIFMIIAIMLLSISLFAVNDMGKGGSYDGAVMDQSSVISLGDIPLNDYPAGQATDVGDGTGTTITPSADLNDAADQTNIPEVPNSSFTAGYKHRFTGSGIVDITFNTSYAYGAYYQNGSWNSVANSGGVILFQSINFDAKGDVPIVLGDENPLPVTLSSFMAIQTSDNLAQINWTTQSENGLNGFNIYRSKSNNYNNSIMLNSSLINPTNSSSAQNYSYTDENVEFEQTYFYWLESVELSGNTELFGPTSLKIKSPDVEELPSVTVLKSAYPNPFNPTTTISFDIKDGETGILTIFNMKGQKIVSENFVAGSHKFKWIADNNASGIYFYKLQTPTYQKVGKMIMLK